MSLGHYTQRVCLTVVLGDGIDVVFLVVVSISWADSVAGGFEEFVVHSALMSIGGYTQRVCLTIMLGARINVAFLVPVSMSRTLCRKMTWGVWCSQRLDAV